MWPGARKSLCLNDLMKIAHEERSEAEPFECVKSATRRHECTSLTLPHATPEVTVGR